MSANPWFKFFPGDYLGDTRRLTQKQHACYLLILIDYYANSGPPPDDDEVLARISLCESVSDWRKERKTIEKYFEIRDNRWFHARCEQELSTRAAERDRKSKGGRKGNEIRWRASHTESVSDRKPEVRSQIKALDVDSPTRRTLTPGYAGARAALADLGVKRMPAESQATDPEQVERHRQAAAQAVAIAAAQQSADPDDSEPF